MLRPDGLMPAFLALSFASTASIAQPIEQGDLTFHLAEVAGGFVAPVHLTEPDDGSSRLFVADQIGRIRIIKNGVVLTEPFLDISGRMVTLNANYDERGLLGVAFHPDFASNGRFFVRYGKPRAGADGEPCKGTARGCHEEILAEFRVSASNPDLADPASEKILIRIPKPQFNHDGGNLAFGPDGYLYFGMGDGGGANDGLADNPPSHGPIGNGQNINTLMGKILRIDVDSGDPYGIPADNPFAGDAPGSDEIFAYGFRNPFQISFDDGPGGDGSLWCGDVGQNLTEEIDIVTLGGNYGWVIKEGSKCFDPFNPNTPPASCDDAGMIDPIAEYDHVNGIAVVGGFVYRGDKFPGLRGVYLCGDYSTSFTVADGHLFYLDTNDTIPALKRPRLGGENNPLALYVKGTGRDLDGEIYFLVGATRGPSGTTGKVLRITRCTADFDGDGLINDNDLDAFVNSFTDGQDSADSDQSGFVDTDDFDTFILAYGAGCESGPNP